MSLLQNSKNTLRPFGKLSAQGERYLSGILIVPFVVSLSNHNLYFCKRLILPMIQEYSKREPLFNNTRAPKGCPVENNRHKP
jgi:hypothetical protein